jgi:hypothetical protein
MNACGRLAHPAVGHSNPATGGASQAGFVAAGGFAGMAEALWIGFTVTGLERAVAGRGTGLPA